MFELKKIEKRETESIVNDEKITSIKWIAYFLDGDDSVSLNATIHYANEPTHLTIGSLYKINLEE